jgi:hypothetical protein
MPWCTKNFLVVNPEWYTSAWDAILPKFDRVILKDYTTEKRIPAKVKSVIRWAHPPFKTDYPPATKDEFLWALAGSANKRAYVPILLPLWKETYPRLTITTVSPLDLSGVHIPSNVEILVRNFEEEERIKFFGQFKGQVCCSRAEGFGYTAAETELFGAMTILNSLPPYVEAYSSDYRVSFLPSRMEGCFDLGASQGALEEALDVAMDSFSTYTVRDSLSRRDKHPYRWHKFVEAWQDLVVPGERPAGLTHLPPILHPNDCPPISVITLIYNRKKFFDLALHSMMISDYPKDKIEWILVDDSDDPNQQNSDRIIAVANSSAPLSMVYVPLAKKLPVSEKRNLGISRAKSEIVLMMDDDDHYPETSFRRRVAWLTKHPWKPKVVSATTIACYDLVRGISAVNSPPMNIPVGQRISEATLTFYKSWWQAKKFPQGVVVGEGEEFLRGRELEYLEIPPQQIIVAFSHGQNVSSRRIPSEGITPGCFWNFPPEFLEFIHNLTT